jgi:RND family efflux transporter MFP subunit
MFEPDRSRPGNPDHAPQLRMVAAGSPPHWDALSDAGNDLAFCFAWLSQQCARVPGIVTALLMLRRGDQEAPMSVSWPRTGLDLPDLCQLAERAYVERRVIVVPGRIGLDASHPQPVGVLVATPLGAGSRPIAVAVVAFATSVGSTSLDPEFVSEQLRWGAGWLEALPWERRSRQLSSHIAQAASCLDLLATIAEQPRFLGMAIATTNELATRLRCDRVSLGLMKRNGAVRLCAISHSASFKKQGPLVDAIENAMEEAIDQCAPVTLPPLPSTSRTVTIAHQALAQAVRTPSTSLMSVALANGKGRVIGAITFERHGDAPFDMETLQLAEALAALLGPIVDLQRHSHRLFAGRIVDGLGDTLAALFGPRRPGLKLGAVSIVALGLLLAFAEAEHRVTARSVLEAEVQRAVVAPFEGFIRAAPVRAGDTVRAGDLLVALDDRDLVLDRLKWRAERDAVMQKERAALAKHDRSSLAVLNAQVQQAESQLALAEEKLARARILAPFAGIIVSGDLSQALGSPVEKGKVLFEIAPLQSYRLIVNVDERDVRYVAAGQTGAVALAGMPWSPQNLIVSAITPVTVAEEGRNSFRVEARLTELSPQLRPGMEGVAKIHAGRRSVMWIWTRAFVEWLSLAAWKYLP